MKKILCAILALIALNVFNSCKPGNSKVAKSEVISLADTVGWGRMHIKLAEGDEYAIMQFRQLEGEYLRRTYLVANLVKVLRANGSFSDKSKLDGLDSAKENAFRFYINENHLDSANTGQYRFAQQRLSGALSNVYVAIDKIRDLKDDHNVNTMLILIAGNRSNIDSARKKYNDAAKDYVGNLAKFPLLAEKAGFKPQPFFESDEMMQSASH